MRVRHFETGSLIVGVEEHDIGAVLKAFGNRRAAIAREVEITSVEIRRKIRQSARPAGTHIPATA